MSKRDGTELPKGPLGKAFSIPLPRMSFPRNSTVSVDYIPQKVILLHYIHEVMEKLDKMFHIFFATFLFLKQRELSFVENVLPKKILLSKTFVMSLQVLLTKFATPTKTATF